MKFRWQFFWHVFFWLSIILLCLFIVRSDEKLTIEDMLVIFALFPAINLTLFYLNYLVLMPQFLDKKRYSIYFLLLIALIVSYGFFKYGVALMFKHYALMGTDGHIIGFGVFFVRSIIGSLLYLFLSVILKFTVDWFLNERIQRDLENQRLTAELAFLKSQINPHFLFNSLNSIYSLAYQRSDTTPEAILKLSEIMRYMLYECNDNKVGLDKELQYLQNYIDLQKIRFSSHAYIDFKIDGNIADKQIVPLMLIAFIENAFKHGVANNPLTPIRLLIDVEAGQLHFYIQNKKHSNNRDEVGGIGLNNVRRRLNLLYAGKFNLNIRDEKDTYTVELSLVL